MSRLNFVRCFGYRGLVFVLALIATHRAAAQSGDNMSGGTSSYYPSMGSYSAPYGFSSTALEGALRGRAALVEAQGNFDVSESQAAILWQHARALDRDNKVQQTVALYAQKDLWRQARDSARQIQAERDAEGKAKFAELRATVYRRAYALEANELNPHTGEIYWPAALQAGKFECERRRVEQLFRILVSYPDPQPQVVEDIGRHVDALVRTLRTDMCSLPRDEYLAAQKFLRGLKYVAG
jgi:hypothetical protein